MMLYTRDTNNTDEQFSEFWNRNDEASECDEDISDSEEDTEIAKSMTCSRKFLGGRLNDRIESLQQAEEIYYQRKNNSEKQANKLDKNAISETMRGSGKQRLLKTLKENHHRFNDIQTEACAETLESECYKKFARSGKSFYLSQMASTVRWLSTASADELRSRFSRANGEAPETVIAPPESSCLTQPSSSVNPEATPAHDGLGLKSDAAISEARVPPPILSFSEFVNRRKATESKVSSARKHSMDVASSCMDKKEIACFVFVEMRVRKLRSPSREEALVVFPRRSPRFLQAKKTGEESPRTPKSATRKTGIRSPRVFKSQEQSEKYIPTRNRKAAESKSLENSKSRRYVRLNGGADVCRTDMGVDLNKRFVIEKRVTRRSVRECKRVKNDASGIVGYSSKSVGISSKDGKSKLGFSLGGPSSIFVEKRVTRNSTKTGFSGKVETLTNVRDRVVSFSSAVRKPKRDPKVCQSFKKERNAQECGIRKLSNDKKCGRTVRIGVKRKMDQMEEERNRVRGWTKEQEIALQRAYFTEKPTPHFWKNVASMVPGKCAKECLDKIHSDQLTPQPRASSKTDKKKPSPLPFSAGKLLSLPETKAKNLKSGRRKSRLSQKMVRQLLQKHHNRDQDYEADLFNVLEPTFESPSLNFHDSPVFASPTPNHSPIILTRSRETSSAHKKHLSRLDISGKMTFSSPPVLKQIKNKVLHERYIDQLHCRDAKRKAALLRNGKCARKKSDDNTSRLAVNSVKLARDALVSDAQDAINQLRGLQSNILRDIDYDSCDGDEDEDEDEL